MGVLNEKRCKIMKNNPLYKYTKKQKTLYKYTIEQKIYNNMVHWYMDKHWYNSIYHNITYIDETHYVFGKHISQNLPMLHT
jgi:hypothetical protein